MNAVYAEFFPQDPPSRSTIQVAGLPKGGAVELNFWPDAQGHDCGPSP